MHEIVATVRVPLDDTSVMSPDEVPKRHCQCLAARRRREAAVIRVDKARDELRLADQEYADAERADKVAQHNLLIAMACRSGLFLPESNTP